MANTNSVIYHKSSCITCKKMVSEIEYYLRNKSTTEIPTSLIGRMVMTRLKRYDKVAYIRFASVYKQFNSVRQFTNELTKLKKKK